MNKNVSIVMVSYHTGPIFNKAIEFALAQEGLKELIIIDNGNPDDVRGEIRRWADREERMRYYTGHGNVGFATGCNIGASYAKGEYLLFLNPDCLLEKGALSKATSEMEKFQDAWLAGICMFGPEGYREANNKRNILSPAVALAEVFQLWKLNAEKFLRINIPESDDEDETSYVPAISGAFMLIKKSRYDEIGGMDEEYFFHVEDLDFCKEVQVQGGKVIYIPSIKSKHFRSSSDVTTFFVEWHKTRGFLRYFKKHYSTYYLGGFVLLINLAIWTRFVVRIPKIMLRRVNNSNMSKAYIEKAEEKI